MGPNCRPLFWLSANVEMQLLERVQLRFSFFLNTVPYVVRTTKRCICSPGVLSCPSWIPRMLLFLVQNLHYFHSFGEQGLLLVPERERKHCANHVEKILRTELPHSHPNECLSK
ncbi:hypothetical protein VNO78_24818 [Psophocarpus tetragonolobus]|uniref:Uncharacterized protein n=1 Tax=Psophocarpus tetragonolobus TaxID=3891 RepID=A0AAN9XFB2_PSOTE